MVTQQGEICFDNHTMNLQGRFALSITILYSANSVVNLVQDEISSFQLVYPFQTQFLVSLGV